MFWFLAAASCLRPVSGELVAICSLVAEAGREIICM